MVSVYVYWYQKKSKKEEYNNIIEATELIKTIFQKVYTYLLESHEGFFTIKITYRIMGSD